MKKVIFFVLSVSVVFFVCVFMISKYDNEPETNVTETVSQASNRKFYAERKTENYEAEDISKEKSSETSPDFHIISDFPSLLQMPELPTGCEITAMTMTLNYYGYDVDKLTMATVYLPTASADLYYDNFGVLHGTDLNNYFIGNPTSSSGCVCGTGAIVTAANDYLSYVGGDMKAKDISGASPQDLYEYIDNDTPIVVWITIGMQERSEAEGWYTDSGEYVDWSSSDHAGVLIGYTQDTVTIADPISGELEYSRETFESVYASRGYHGVILE